MKPARSNRFLAIIRSLATAQAIVMSFFGVAHATQIAWSGATNTTWATGTNWTGGVAPVSSITTDSALFSLGTAMTPNAGTTSISGIQIGTGAATGALTLSGTQLTIGTGGIDMKTLAAASTVSSPITLGAAQTWQNASANLLTVGAGAITCGANLLTVDGAGAGGTTISGIMSGTGGLTKNGTGKLTLSALNTNNGPGTINNGEVSLTAANGVRGAWTINNGGILRGSITDAIDYISTITVNAGGQLINSSAAGGYNQLYNNNGGGNVLTMNGGTLSSTATPHANYGSFLLRGNMTVGGSQKSTISADFRMGDNATRDFNVGATGDASGVDLDVTAKFTHFEGVTAGYMTKSGAGTMRFANPSHNNNIYSVTVNAGKVIFKDDMNGMPSGLINNSLVTADMGTGINATYGNAFSGSGSFTKTGVGTLTVTGKPTYTGATIVSGGTLSIPEVTSSPTFSVADGAGLAFSAGAVGTQIGNGIGSVSSLTLGSTGAGTGTSLTFANFSSNSGTPLMFPDVFTTHGAALGTTIKVSGNFTGTGTFPLIWSNGPIQGDGFGTLAAGGLPRNVTAHLTNTNGGQNLNLVVDSLTPTTWVGNISSTWDINTTSNWAGVSNVYLDNDIVVFNDTATGAGAVTVALNTTTTPTGVAPQWVTVSNPTRAYTISGTAPIAGATGLSKSGAGTLTLGTPNTFTGLVNIDGGTLKVGNAAALGSAGVLNGTTVNTGGVLDLNGTAMTAEPLTLNGSGISSGGALINSSATAASTAATVSLASATSVGGSGNITLSGLFTGSSELTKVGGGTTTLSAASTGFTGPVVVNAGVLASTAGNNPSGSIGRASSITVNNGGTISAAGGDNSFAIYFGDFVSRPLQINTGGLVTNPGSPTNHLNAVVMNGGTLNAAVANGTYGSWNFDNGVSTLGNGLTSYITGGNFALTQSGGTVFDIGAGDTLHVTSTAAHTSSSPDNGLIKNGAGAMVMNSNTYTSNTVVNAGSLTVPAIQSSPSFFVADDAELVITGNPGSSFSVSSLSMGSGGAKSLRVRNFGEQMLAANAPVKASTLFDNWGALNLDVNGSFTTPGTYPLISYPVGGYYAGAFDDVTLSLPPNVTGILQDNPAAKTMDLVISAVNTLVWKGAPSGVWDVNNAAAWFVNSSAPTGKYLENMVVRFDDSATGTTSVALGSVITPSGVTVNNPTKNYTISGAGGIAGSTALTKSGAGMLTLATANTYTGLTTINAGTLQLGNGTNNGSVTGSIINNSNLSLNNGTAQSYAGSITGTGSLTKLGAGTFVLSAAPAHTGATTVSAGTLQVPSLTSSSSITTNATLAFNQTGTTEVNPAGVIGGSGVVAYTGPAVSTSLAGQFLVDDVNTYAGGTTISTSRVNLTNPSGIGTGAVTVNNGGQLLVSAGTTTINNPLTINGLGWIEGSNTLGALRLSGGPTIAGPITLGSNSRISAHDSYGYISGAISGNFDLEFNANGGTQPIHLIGTSVNTYTGKTILNNAMVYLNKTGTPAIFGTLQMGAGNTAQPRLVMQQSNQFGSGVELIGGNTTGNWARFEMQGTNQTLAGISTGTTTVQGGAIIQNRSINDTTSNFGTATLTLNGNGNYVFNSYMRDSDNGASATNRIAIVKNGSGTQTLAGTQITYTGNTDINQGRLVVMNTGTAFDTTTTTISSGAVLEFNAPSGTIQLNNNGQTLQGAGSIVKTGAGELWFGANGQNINISLSAGALIDVQQGKLRNEYSAGIWTNNQASLNVASGATFDIWDSPATIVDALTGAGTVNEGIGASKALTVGVANGSGTFSGVLANSSGTLALTKTGIGTQTLSGVSTYTGATTITGGTLALGASGSINATSAVTIASGAVFDVSAAAGFTQATGKSLTAGRTSGSGNDIVGNYTTGGAVNVAGTNTVGTLTVGGNLSLTGGTVAADALRYDLSSSAASGNDLIAATGTLSLAGTTTVNPVFNGTPDIANPYTLITHGGGTDGVNRAASFAVALPAASRYTASIVDTTTTPGAVKMQVSGTGMSLVWAGAPAATWLADATIPNAPTQNWTASAAAQNFQNLDSVTFDGTSAVGAVALTTTVVPSSILVNSSTTAYTISGAGGVIAGGGNLTKSGTSTLTLSTANTFSGGALISQGQISSGNGSAMGTGTVVLNDANTGANDTALLASAIQTCANNVMVTNNGSGTVKLGSVSGLTGLVNYNGTFNLGKAVTINGSSDRTTFNGKISGSGPITIAGSSTHRVTFANPANDFTGLLTINSGMIYQSDSPTALLASTDIANAGTYRFSGGGTHAVDSINGAGAINIAGGGASTFSLGNANGASDISGVISDNAASLSLVKNGTGSLTLSAANTFTGTTTLNSGTTFLTHSSALGGSTLMWDNLGGTLNLGSLTALSLGGLQGAQDFPMLNNSSVAIALTVGGVANSSVHNGRLLGGTTFTKVGTGSFIMGGSAANTYTGLTTVSAGNLGLSKPANVAAVPGSLTMTNNEGTRVYMTQDNQFGAGSVLTLSGGSGNSRIEMLGTTQTFAGLANDGTGRGVVQVREQVLAPLVSPTSTLILDVPTAASYSYNGYLRNSGGLMKLVKNGPGKQILGGGANVSFTGGTIVNGGTLEFNAGNTTDGQTGGFVLNAGTTMQSVAATNVYGGIVMNGATLAGVGAGNATYGHFVMGSNLTVGGTQKSVISADLRVGSAADRTINVGLTGDPSGVDLEVTGKFGHLNGSSYGYITKAGAGTMRFNNPALSSDIGRITVNAGKMIFKDYMAVMADGGLILNAGGTVDADMGTGIDHIYNSKLAGSTGVFNKIGAGNLTIAGAGGTFAGTINVIDGKLIGKAQGAFGAANGSRAIIVSPGKSLEFHAANIFGNHGTTAAPIIVNNATITNADPAATGKVNNGLGSLTLNNGQLTATVGNGISVIDATNRPNEGYGAWGLNGVVTSTGASTINVGPVTGMGGRILLGSTSAGTTFNVVDGTLTVSAPLQGSDGDTGGLTKTGTGKLVLSAVNIYRAATLVNAGTLELNGSLVKADGAAMTPSNITVASGATFKGTGTAAGTLTANGIIAPGSSIGTLAVGATTFGATGSLVSEINSSTLASDILAITGNLNIDTAATLMVTDLGSATVPGGAKIVLMTYTGTWDTGTFAGHADDSLITVGANTYTLNYDDTVSGANAVTLTKTGVADAYTTWASSYGLAGANSAKSADPDKDGNNNLLEFATNSDPSQGGSGPRVYPLMFTIGADNALTFTAAVRTGAVFAAAGTTQIATKDQVLYTFEASNELSNWTTVPVTEVTGTTATNIRAALGAKLTAPALGADWEWHTFRTDLGSQVDAGDFIRLKVNVAP